LDIGCSKNKKAVPYGTAFTTLTFLIKKLLFIIV